MRTLIRGCDVHCEHGAITDKFPKLPYNSSLNVILTPILKRCPIKIGGAGRQVAGALVVAPTAL